MKSNHSAMLFALAALCSACSEYELDDQSDRVAPPEEGTWSTMTEGVREFLLNGQSSTYGTPSNEEGGDDGEDVTGRVSEGDDTGDSGGSTGGGGSGSGGDTGSVGGDTGSGSDTGSGGGGGTGGGGGSDTGTGGSDTGTGGSDTGTGGSDTGSGGIDTGTGGSDTGSGGIDTGSGGSDTGSGGIDTGDPGQCDTFYSAKWDAGGSSCTTINDGNGTMCVDGTLTNGTLDGCGMATVTPVGNEIIVTIPSNCSFISASSKCSTGCEEAIISPDGTTATFVDCPDGNGGYYTISHTEAAWCCE